SHPSGLSFPTAKPGQSFGRDQAPGGGFIQEEGLETEDSDQDQDQDQEEWEPHSPPAQPRPRKSGTSGRLRGLAGRRTLDGNSDLSPGLLGAGEAAAAGRIGQQMSGGYPTGYQHQGGASVSPELSTRSPAL
ncbi:unnamed protein product, partial [Polarella glacialis]